MSIESPTPANKMSSPEKHRSKEGKKHKSPHGERKRKRDHTENGHRSKSKSKKQRSEKILEDLPTTEPSPFHLQTASLYLPLAPISQAHPLEGLCAEHLSPLLLTYYPPLNGVILSYSNIRLSETPYGSDDPKNYRFHNIDEYAVSWSWVTADFLLFKPELGVELEGYVNLQSQGHLGIVCWNLFNASIEAKRLPRGWKWVDVGEIEKEGGNEGYAEVGQGCWVDENGEKVEGQIRFNVLETDGSSDRERGFLSIGGTMLSEEDVELMEEEGDGVGSEGRKPNKLGSTDLSVPVEVDMMAASGGSEKQHKRKY